jgi:hypothetical protein
MAIASPRISSCALSTATSESVADEFARAAMVIFGEQLSQREVPLSK